MDSFRSWSCHSIVFHLSSNPSTYHLSAYTSQFFIFREDILVLLPVVTFHSLEVEMLDLLQYILFTYLFIYLFYFTTLFVYFSLFSSSVSIEDWVVIKLLVNTGELTLLYEFNFGMVNLPLIVLCSENDIQKCISP